jgi:hypothetical protein
MADEKTPAPAPAVADETRAAELKAVADAAAKAERERAAGIRLAVRAAKLGDEMAEQLINDGTGIDKARALVLDKLASKSEEIRTEQHVVATVTEDNRDQFVRGATAWLIEKAGSNVIERAARAGVDGFKTMDRDPGEYRGTSLMDLARESLERRGFKTRGMGKMQNCRRGARSRNGGYGDHKRLQRLARKHTWQDSARRLCHHA